MLKNKLKNKKKGFTLIELIVVLAVLAIIALIAIPNFNQIRENSKIKSDERGADLIDKSVTLLVQDGSIEAPASGGAKSAVYSYDTAKKEMKLDKDTLTQKEADLVLATINDGKAPQSYNQLADWKIDISGLGTKEPKVVVSLRDDNDKVVYSSDKSDVQTGTVQ